MKFQDDMVYMENVRVSKKDQIALKTIPNNQDKDQTFVNHLFEVAFPNFMRMLEVNDDKKIVKNSVQQTPEYGTMRGKSYSCEEFNGMLCIYINVFCLYSFI